jgi:crotonobetainyl-CoA:carnitine CoA-transferase CaiB-like acyl-CoA transferase
VAELDDAEYGHLKVSGLPFFLDGRPGRVDQRAPKLGEHTRQVLESLKYPKEKIQALLDKEVVRAE